MYVQVTKTELTTKRSVCVSVSGGGLRIKCLWSCITLHDSCSIVYSAVTYRVQLVISYRDTQVCIHRKTIQE